MFHGRNNLGNKAGGISMTSGFRALEENFSPPFRACSHAIRGFFEIVTESIRSVLAAPIGTGQLINRMRDGGQQVVVTGGTGSLGRAIARAFVDEGCSVASPGSQELDVCDSAAVSDYFHDRSVDLLVCAAGIVRDAPLARLTEQAWEETWNVNFKGALMCAEAALAGMMEKGWGHVVFISSFSALHPPPGQVAYATAKASLLGLVSDLAVRHGSSNIRINAVLPGFLETPMTATVTDRRRAEVLDMHTLGRFNTCENAAKFISFLHHHMPDTSGQLFQLDSRLDFW